MLMFKVIFTFSICIILQLVFAGSAFAWGPAIHTVIACRIIEEANHLLPAIASIIQSFSLEYVYGSMAADFFIGKGQKKKKGHSHNWASGFRLLDEVMDEREAAYAYGFLSHLAADIVAHNYFVPDAIHRVSTWKRAGHLYSEAIADYFVGPFYMRIARDILSMDQLVATLLHLLGIGAILSFTYFSFLSLKEGERRAARISALLALTGSLPIAIALWTPAWVHLTVLLLLGGAGLTALILFLLPIGSVDTSRDVPHQRYDERDIMFAREEYSAGSEKYETYYRANPDKKAIDDRIKALPEILQPGGKYYDEKDNLMRILNFKEVKTLGGRTIPAEMEMIPMTKEGQKTIIRYLDAKFNEPLDASIFTRRNLQKRR